MSTGTKRKLWLTGGAVVGVFAAIPAIGSLRWPAQTARSFDQLTARSRSAPGAFSNACLAGLPTPVVRYFHRVLPEGQPIVQRVELLQDAQFFVGGAWRPLHASQRFTTTPPGFVWDARIRMAPLVSVYVRDGYIDGAASMRAALGGIYPIVNQAGRPELDAGALHRYLAEAVWFPTALLPGQGVSWTAIDDRSALASLSEGETTVSLQFRFNDADEVVEVVAPDRFREVNGRYEPTPWTVRCTDYENPGGMRIPVQCEVAWQLPDGPLPYWRGRILDIRYDVAH